MTAFYEPRENIAGAARRANRSASLREIPPLRRSKPGDFSERARDGFRSLETWVQNNPTLAVGFLVVSIAILYVIYGGA